MRNISGRFPVETEDNQLGWTGVDGAFYLASSTYANGEDSDGGDEWILGFDASRVIPTANENRPVNMSVRYLIRALP
jgi:hypothetical protein